MFYLLSKRNIFCDRSGFVVVFGRCKSAFQEYINVFVWLVV